MIKITKTNKKQSKLDNGEKESEFILLSSSNSIKNGDKPKDIGKKEISEKEIISKIETNVNFLIALTIKLIYYYYVF